MRGDQHFTPAVLAANVENAKFVARNELRKSYDAHRAAIDEVFQMASKKVQEDEFKSAEMVKRGLWASSALGVAIVIVVFFLSWLIASAITKPLGQTVAALKDIAQGEGI